MAETIKEGDFIELDYTGRVPDENVVFDTTIEDVAKKNGLHDQNSKYGPVKICVGKRHVIAGLDSALVGKELSREYAVKVSPKDAFGEKNAKMIQLIATNKFRQQGIMPVPGLQVNMDGVLGTVKAVSGGRTVVDFNHPLSGKELEYSFNAKRIITDVKEKVNAILEVIGVKLDSEVAGDKLVLKADSELPKDVQDALTKAITESVSEIKTVSFEKKQGAAKAETPEQQDRQQ